MVTLRIIIYISIILCLLSLVRSVDDCTEKIRQSLYELKSMSDASKADFSNPALASGTNLNDLGKYDACISNKTRTYILVNFPLPIKKDDLNIPLPIFIGLCAPKECENEVAYYKISQYIVNFINETSLTIDKVKVVSSEEENNKYKHFNLSHYVVLFILVFYLIFALGFVNCLYSSSMCKRRQNVSLHKIDRGDFKNFTEEKEIDKKKVKEVLLTATVINNLGLDQGSSLDSNSVKTDVISLAESATKVLPPIHKERRQFIDGIHKVAATLFDFPKNFATIFEKRRTEENDLKIFDGIRALTAAWIIVCHSFLSFSDMPQRNPETVLENYIRTFRWQILFNSSFSVDVFFSMSGFLMTYITLRRRETMQKASCMKIVMGVLFRLLRVWPLFILIFLAYWKFYIYLLDGPYSGFIFNNEIESCNIQWPFMMLLINNFTLGKFEGAKFPWCVSWGWYIPNDFQLSVIGIVFLLVYLKNRKAFFISFLAVNVVCIIGEGIQFYRYKFGANIFDINDGGAEYMFIYYLLYIRCGPYFMGYLLGIFYAEYKEDEKHNRDTATRRFFATLKTTKIYYILSYILGIAIMLTVVFVVYFSYQTKWSLAGKVIYNIISRKGFVLGLFMTCLPIMQGNLQSIGSWLGSDLFIPLSKVSFAVYVIHPFIIRYIYYNFRHAVYFEMSMMFLYAFSFIVVVYILSIFVTTIFEVPFMNLRLLLDNRHQSKKEVTNTEESIDDTISKPLNQ